MERGTTGVLLKHEELPSSTVIKQRAKCALAGVTGYRPARSADQVSVEMKRLQGKNERLLGWLAVIGELVEA